jgi:ribulose-phosphate 3-epimerase
MRGPVGIAPSILAADYSRLGEQVRAAEAAGVESIHCDVMDGHFVPPITFGPLIVEAVRRSVATPIDVHMMVEHPETYIDAIAAAGANLMTVHLEACPHLNRVLQLIHAAGMGAGVAINPATPAAMVEEVLPHVELLLVMSINPGWGGQPFMPDVLPKLRRVREMIDASGRDIRLQIDGGITSATAPLAVAAGADLLVAGTAVFNERESVADAVAHLRRAVAAA